MFLFNQSIRSKNQTRSTNQYSRKIEPEWFSKIRTERADGENLPKVAITNHVHTASLQMQSHPKYVHTLNELTWRQRLAFTYTV
jgi:hypothetical protein